MLVLAAIAKHESSTRQRPRASVGLLGLVFVSIVVIQSPRPVVGQHLVQPPVFAPCQFPVPSNTEFFHHMCHPHRELPFLCDLHNQLDGSGLYTIAKAYKKHRPVFHDNGTDLFGLILVRQLAQPISVDFLKPESEEFGCLYATPCLSLSTDQLDKFVHNFKFFTKVYTSVVYRRWFPDDQCPRPKVLALVLVDGFVFDPRKLTMVVIHQDEARLKPFTANLQLESTNCILRGQALHECIADLIDHVGFALRDFYATGGHPRRHGIPPWAFQLAAISMSLVVIAMIFEWCIVRRKLLVNRNHSTPVGGIRSKTHLIF